MECAGNPAAPALAIELVRTRGIRTARVPLERAQEMFERLESPGTRDLKILLAPSAAGS